MMAAVQPVVSMVLPVKLFSLIDADYELELVMWSPHECVSVQFVHTVVHEKKLGRKSGC